MKGSDNLWDIAVPWTSDSCLLQKGVAKAKLQYNSWQLILELRRKPAHTVLDPEIDRVDLWQSIRGKYRSTRSIDSTFGPSHDSARLSASAIDSTDFILDSLYLPRFLADHTNSGAYGTVMLRLSPFVVIVVSELWINDASYSKIKLLGPIDSL